MASMSGKARGTVWHGAGAITFAAALLALLTVAAMPAFAEVRYGNNVRIGGNRIAPHSAQWVKIRTITGYSGPLGCRTFAKGATIDGVWHDGPIRRCVYRNVPVAKRR